MKSYGLVIILSLLSVASSCAQCPAITVIGPAGVTNPGDKMTFTATVPGSAMRGFRWTVSAGTIIEGQGTPMMRVLVDSTLEGTNITATVEVDGLAAECLNRASEAAPVATLPIGEPIDEWRESLKPNVRRARLDLFFHELNMNPGQVGIVVLEGPHPERLDSKNARVQFVVRHAKFRHFNWWRLWFTFKRGGSEREVVIWRMLPDVAVPCDGCPVLKGSQIDP